MWKLLSVLGWVTLLLLCSYADLVAAQRSTRSKWQTLNGDPPLVVARGGFSGVFPDSSIYAYQVAVQTGLSDLHVWCDVQLTKDGVGICFPDILLQNASNVDSVLPNRQSTFAVNGVSTQGWFSVDFTFKELEPVSLIQRIFSRPFNFDNVMPILTVEDINSQVKIPGLWLNVAHNAFYSEHNQSMRSYVLSVSRRVVVNYVSSPEVGFLRSLVSRLRTSPTKLVFKFLGTNDVEPSMNQTYGSLLGNLTFIKTFASGILVPKYYIWPVDNKQYLQNYTSLVLDAHREGLAVFAYNFANDAAIPYDFSFDPVSEYLSFVDNGQFSVDGVISDFPVTPSQTIDCFSHMGKNDTVQAQVLIISNEGASAEYPGCTDMAYEKAVSDGVDVIDCPVQMTKDGTLFCLGSINIRDRTNAAQSDFSNLTTDNPDLNINQGIFSYDLTWSQIQRLKPAMYNPYSNYSLFRNPQVRTDGKFMQLSDFLAFASNTSSVTGVLITIENAAYLAQKQGLGITDAVLDILNKSRYNNQTAKKVMIRSSDSAVLKKFKSSNSSYELVYLVDENIREILNSTIVEISKFANSVVISKASVFPVDKLFLTGETTVVPILQAFKLQVYVQYFQNEFVSQPWDFYSDPYAEINTHVMYMGVQGIITDFPATAARYRRNRCLGYKDLPNYMLPVQPGGLISLMQKDAQPPAQPPNPVLTERDVTEPPLPPVVPKPTDNAGTGSAAPGPTQPNGQSTVVSSTLLGCVAFLLAALVLW